MRRSLILPGIALRPIVSVLLVFSSLSGSAQDLIIKLNGDTIHCKVRGMDDAGIFYRHMVGVLVEDAYIRRSEVKEIRKGVTKERIGPTARARTAGGYERFRFGLDAGPSWVVEKPSESIPEWLQEYENELRSGWSFGFDFHYMTTPEWGLGLRANFFRTRHIISNVSYVMEDGSVILGDLGEDVQVSLIGPSFLLMPDMGGDGRFRLVFHGSVGVAEFRDDITYLVPLVARGVTVGGSAELGMEYRPGSGFCFGIQGGRIFAKFNNTAAGTTDLSRWDAAATLGYCF